MVPITALWLPILVSAVVVWLGSSVVWMVIKHHKTDFKPFPDEEAVRSALRGQALPPGQYVVPYAPDPSDMKNPEIVRKCEEGPVGFFTALPTGQPNMGKQLGLWFAYLIVVGILVAYLAGRTLGGGEDYWPVFRVAGTAAFFVYGVGIFSEAIWFGMPWKTAAKHAADGLFYALLTAGSFGGLWPDIS